MTANDKFMDSLIMRGTARGMDGVSGWNVTILNDIMLDMIKEECEDAANRIASGGIYEWQEKHKETLGQLSDAATILGYYIVCNKGIESVMTDEFWRDIEVKSEYGSNVRSGKLVFGSSTKSTQKLSNQMNNWGWTEELIGDTIDNPYTTRGSINKATGNPATVFYTEQGSYVIVDDVTNEIVQISDNINPQNWIPDTSIEDPYKP